jgi:hypothetical protein
MYIANYMTTQMFDRGEGEVFLFCRCPLGWLTRDDLVSWGLPLRVD